MRAEVADSSSDRTSPGRVGIVTVTYNSAAVLPEFLRSVFSQSYENFLLIAVDNASSDTTLELLRAEADSRLCVMQNSSNLGIAEADNQGIAQALAAGCSSILLLNNDTEFEPSLLARLVEGLEQYSCDMICPKMLFYEKPDRIWAAGGEFKPHLGFRTFHYGEGELDHGQYDQPKTVTFAPACCLLVRSELLARIGWMDARYFVYSDDADFLYRALRANATLFYLPTAVLRHKVSSLTGGDTSPFSIRFSTRNRAFFKLKHFNRFKALFWNWVVRAYYLLQFLRGNSSFAVLVMRQQAISEAYRMPRTGDGSLAQRAGQ